MDSAKKGLYGWLAGFFAAGLLQPLENIKMVLIIPPKDVILTRNFLQNFVIAVKYLARDKSFESFYKGLVPNIMKTACSSAVYFTLLRHLEQFNRSANSTDSNTMANSFFSSLIARVASALVANPLAVVETRFYYAGNYRWVGGVMSSLGKISKEEGFRGYWKGGLASCCKEGGFAGLYYAMYTKGKDFGLAPMTSGLLSGVIATAITHPFYIIRTELQTLKITHDSRIKQSMFSELVALISSGQALKGVTPRLVKKPLTNTIAFVAFEMLYKQNIAN